MHANIDSDIRRIDQSELRTQQAFGPLLLIAAYILDDWRLVAVQCGIFLLTALRHDLGPYVLLYRFVLKPLGIIEPDIRADNPEPHRFATLFGLAVASVAAFFLATGKAAAGWTLVWILAIFGAGGFFRHGPIGGSGFPGSRPPKSGERRTWAR